MSDTTTPTLLFVIGPAAVGKMTVGGAIAERTGFKLFHNHLTIEPLLRLFPYESSQFQRLNHAFREQIFAEAAASDLPGLVFTLVWDFDDPEDAALVERYSAPFRERGSRVLFLELSADQSVRLERNAGESRLAEKASKRDLAWSNGNLVGMDAKYRLNSVDDFAHLPGAHLLIDNTDLEPGEVAERAVEHFGLRPPS
ncbi:shikimate kinase [Streptomyces sp. CB01881]|uniref:shikimate kinase n=1 Tax=Streptomyces sp. CB01881 TaxID=2078691 RepID=UPI0011DFE82A|nr:shikimate kinase [Streptomyces sp. CB01881]TYC66589.1 shikimate kinase [Streptomyces sp. CB01881]